LKDCDNPLDTSRQTISVCIATYNGAKFIARQLGSILPQLGPADEVIISDDSSSDETLSIIEGFSDPRIQILKNNTFRSSTYNFENALSHAGGEIIFLSDQDDEWVEGWVRTALRELETVDLVVCDAFMIDAYGGTSSVPDAIFDGERRPGVLRNFFRNRFVGCCCAFRRRVLNVALPFPENLPWHDWWIGLIADSCFKTRFLSDKMIRYRRHGSNASPTGGKSPYSLRKKIAMRWNLGLPLAVRYLKTRLRMLG
jgi:glycosyltransferase involved in cell wall biosynthesis